MATALTTPARVKEWLNITGTASDWLVNQMIAAVCDRVERYCARTFGTATYTSWLDGTGAQHLLVPNYPITALTRVCFGTEPAGTITNAASGATLATVRITDTTMVLTVTGGASAGTETLTLATYGTQTLLAAAVLALGTGWTLTPYSGLASEPATDLRPTPGRPALTRNGSVTVLLEIVAMPEDDVVLDDADTGRLYRPSGFPRGRNHVFVEYTGGYALDSIPQGLEEIVAKIISSRMTQLTNDPMLQSERLGDYAYTRRAVGDLTQEDRVELAPYARQGF